jgi:hypothetical protein
MIPIQALINWVLNYGNKQEKKMAREAEEALEKVHKWLLEYRNHIASLREAEAFIHALRLYPSIRLVRNPADDNTRKLYWADDTRQWEVYSRDANLITWYYKGDSLTDALAAFLEKP